MISWKKQRHIAFLSFLIFLFSFNGVLAQGDAKNGQTLFKSKCSSCHALDKQVVGPALGGVVARLKKDQNLDEAWLLKWIKNNEALRKSGDKYANQVYEKFNKTQMTVFADLSDQNIKDILEYTSNPPKEEPKADAAGGAGAGMDATAISAQKEQDKKTTAMLLITLGAITGLLTWVLLKLRQLVKLQADPLLTPEDAKKTKSFGEYYKKYNKVAKALLGLLALLALYGLWNALMGIGVYKGYRPEQPIYFSHKIHAGENKIDCQLCHSSAKYGKVSEIPSVNVCMNCHRNISEYKGKYIEPGKTREFYTGQIKEIYKASGWSEEKQAYVNPPKPIQWTRIHNMPDFVYFNHAQHVVAGEQAIISSWNKKNKDNQIDVVCKACHGKIDTMNVVEMANDFTMGWCIECHRSTEVDMTNGYNKEYFKNLHTKLKKQYPASNGKVTVESIGGLECGKCHY